MQPPFGIVAGMIGEPEAASRVEDNVVGRQQSLAVAFGIQHFDLAGRDVDAFDATALVRRRRVTGNLQAVHFVHLEVTAIVAAIEMSIWTDGEAVWSAAGRGDRLRRAVHLHARDASGRNLDDDDRAVVHGDWSFGKFQTGGDFLELHERLPWGFCSGARLTG